MLMKKLLLLFLVIAILVPFPGHRARASEPTKDNKQSSIIDALRKGGYILYIRHGEATIGEDQPNVDFKDCRTQRNLSDEGKKQAQAIGQLYTDLHIPIGYPVLASPYCRARESAGIAFGERNVKVIPFFADIVKLSMANTPKDEKLSIINNFTKMLEIAPPPGTNRIMVGHSFPSGTALGEIPSMGTLVIRPGGQGNGYEIVQKLSLDDLMKLAQTTQSKIRQGPL